MSWTDVLYDILVTFRLIGIALEMVFAVSVLYLTLCALVYLFTKFDIHEWLVRQWNG
jgi:hypothetical protein